MSGAINATFAGNTVCSSLGSTASPIGAADVPAHWKAMQEHRPAFFDR